MKSNITGVLGKVWLGSWSSTVRGVDDKGSVTNRVKIFLARRRGQVSRRWDEE